jgi:predicted nucleotidyltransferase
MAKKRPKSSRQAAERFYSGADIPMRVIRQYARAVAERFRPDKIILFGSHAYGTPNADSDVDLLVIMPARNQGSKAGRIRWEVQAPFPMDLIVRTPEALRWRLEEGDSFLREIVSRGKVLHEKPDQGVGEESGGGLPSRGKAGPRRRAPYMMRSASTASNWRKSTSRG